MLKDIAFNPIMLTDCYNLSHQELKVNTDWEVSHLYNRAKGMILYGIKERVKEFFDKNTIIEKEKWINLLAANQKKSDLCDALCMCLDQINL